jgi:hypothetical protein
MYCQTEPLDLLLEQNDLFCTFGRLRSSEGTSGQLHPDDLKGLRDWVCAKRVEELKTRRCNLRMYSAPWRIG